jgi:octaheme c-type cytochrome (tetrathionate reductase family)
MPQVRFHLALGVALALGCSLAAAEATDTSGGEAAVPPAPLPDFEYHPPYEPVLIPPGEPEQRSGKEPGGTADHHKFTELQKDFRSGPEVTKACLGCHTEAGKDFMKSVHWTWEYKNPVTGQLLGKKNLINTFCTNARGNEGACAQCHAGYGWVDDSFDFTDETKIDCLVCHDKTGLYYRMPQSKGNAACAIMFENAPPLDWKRMAQNVGMPRRRNCGQCHFYGGGDDGAKHGDLDSSLFHPAKVLDVHMDEKGLNFSCTVCHVTKNHIWAGSRYNVVAKDTGGAGKPGLRRDVATCESCHGVAPHPNRSVEGFELNTHVDRVACQTCHIPQLARGGVATMTDWDWRTAGKLKDGFGYFEHNYTQGNGEHRKTYKSIKGDFKWGENLTPHYDWFNGQMIYTTIDSKLDPLKQPVAINAYQGSPSDPDSRIWPFKRMHTVQPYDKGNNTLVFMHLWGEDNAAYWGNYDFGKAIEVGMKEYNKPYSGEFGFIETYSFWPTTHMVAPANDALSCNDCHSKDGRLEGIPGVYIAGRDSNPWLDRIGLLVVLGTLVGVLGHGLIRKITNKGGKQA